MCRSRKESLHDPTRRLARYLVFYTALVHGASHVAAQPDPPSAGAPSSDQRRQRAQELNAGGLDLYKAGDVAGALDAFLESRRLYPAATNTINAANCLAQLERFDEALDRYEEALVKYSAGLTEPNKVSIGETIAHLSQQVGTLEITANGRDFVVLVDGRRRVELRSGGRLRLLGGEHSLRILRDGYAPQEITVRLGAGELMTRSIVLKPIGAMLRVEVEGDPSPGFQVFVDGGRVGTTPWEGSVSPGEHIVRTENDDAGSMVTRVVTVEGEVKVLQVSSRQLGPGIRVEVEPRTAEIKLDGIPLGRGRWAGRLPIGVYALSAAETGYHPRTVPLAITRSHEPLTVRVKLDLDPENPRWPKPKGVHFWVGASAGFGFAPFLGSGAEADCPAKCEDHRGAFGFVAGLRGGFEFPFGVSLELEGGFTWLQASFNRVETDRFPLDTRIHTVRYELHDELRVAGPFVAGGASYRRALNERFGLYGGLLVGVLIASSRDPVEGIAVSGDTRDNLIIPGWDVPSRSPAVFLMPEVGGLLRLGKVELGLGLRVGAFLTDGPAFSHQVLTVENPTACPGPTSAAATCAPDSPVIAGERAYGRFPLVAPTLRAVYAFD